MPLPRITHLQFLVLSLLDGGELSGRYLRERLDEVGERKSGPAFYQLMARLEESGFVEGWYEVKPEKQQLVPERSYRITETGVQARDDAQRFYLEPAVKPPRIANSGRTKTSAFR